MELYAMRVRIVHIISSLRFKGFMNLTKKMMVINEPKLDLETIRQLFMFTAKI